MLVKLCADVWKSYCNVVPALHNRIHNDRHEKEDKGEERGHSCEVSLQLLHIFIQLRLSEPFSKSPQHPKNPTPLNLQVLFGLTPLPLCLVRLPCFESLAIPHILLQHPRGLSSGLLFSPYAIILQPHTVLPIFFKRLAFLYLHL